MAINEIQKLLNAKKEEGLKLVRKKYEEKK